MKKFSCLFLCVLLILSIGLISCNSNPTTTSAASSETKAFSVDSSTYSTLQEAIDSLADKADTKDATATIKLLMDVTDPGATISDVSSALKIDFQDFTYTIENGGTGIVVNNGEVAIEISGGKIEVEEGSTLTNSAVITVKSNTAVTISGTNLEVKADYDAIESSAGELIIKGKTEVTTKENRNVFVAKEDAKINVESSEAVFTGTFSVKGTSNIILSEGATFNLTEAPTKDDTAFITATKDNFKSQNENVKPEDLTEKLHEHTWDEGTINPAATCETDGVKTYKCECGATKTEVIKATGHSYGDPEWEWAKDFSSAVLKYTCTIDPTHVLEIKADITSEVTKEPTCTESGSKTCTATAKYGETTVTDTKTVTLPATGHSNGKVEWVWAEDYSTAKAKFICGNDSSHVQEVDATISSKTTQATCTEDGSTTYTASATYDELTVTDIKTVTLPATGHSNGSVEWVWAEDYSTAKAKFICGNDSSHVQEVGAKVTSTTTDATYTEAGSTTYTATATYGELDVNDTKTKTIPVKEIGDGIWQCNNMYLLIYEVESESGSGYTRDIKLVEENLGDSFSGNVYDCKLEEKDVFYSYDSNNNPIYSGNLALDGSDIIVTIKDVTNSLKFDKITAGDVYGTWTGSYSTIGITAILSKTENDSSLTLEGFNPVSLEITECGDWILATYIDPITLNYTNNEVNEKNVCFATSDNKLHVINLKSGSTLDFLLSPTT